MKLDFTVSSVRKGHVSADAMVNDVRQRVLIDGLEVVLITAEGRSLSLPIYGAVMEEAEKIFQPDAKVTFTVEAA